MSMIRFIVENPYRWAIFYFVVQSLVFIFEAIYLYFQFKYSGYLFYELLAMQLLTIVLLLLAITFILLTASGENHYRRQHKNI